LSTSCPDREEGASLSEYPFTPNSLRGALVLVEGHSSNFRSILSSGSRRSTVFPYTFGGLLTTPIAKKITKKLIQTKKSIFANPTNVTTTPEIQRPRKTIAATRNKSAKVIIAAPELGYKYGSVLYNYPGVRIKMAAAGMKDPVKSGILNT
jgi:hypothetical protein